MIIIPKGLFDEYAKYPGNKNSPILRKWNIKNGCDII